MKRIGIATVAAFALLTAVAYAVEINPFVLPYSGPAQGGNAEVGFKVVKQDGHKWVKKFQFDSVVAECGKNDKKVALADQIQGEAKISKGDFAFAEVGVVNDPHGKVIVKGHKIAGQDAYTGSLQLYSSWKGQGLCHMPKADWEASND